MKKLSYLIILTLILGLVLTGCSLMSNVGQVPTSEQNAIAYLTKGVPLSVDLVGLWRFNGDSKDSSGNELDGTVTGADYVDGVSGQSLYFDGDDYVMVPDSSLLEPSEITVEAWVKRNGSPGSCKYIVSKYLHDKYGSYSSYGLYTGSGGIRFYIGHSGGWIGSPQASHLVVWDGEWHHVAGTFDGSEVKLYVDKVQVVGATSTTQDIYYYETGNLYIGAYTDSSFLAFSGTIDEVRIWNGALLPGQLDSVIYDFGGILPPIKADGSSIFKLGRTIPVKFQLRDDQGNFVPDADAEIYLFKLSNGVTGTVWEDAVSTAAATTGNLFRYDSDNEQYIFNLATKSLDTGTWRIKIKLDDGTSKFVDISLK